MIPKELTNPRVIRKFIVLTFIATFVGFTFWAIIKPYFVSAPSGDYEVRQGDILLGDKKFDEAIERFDVALEKMPNHRGALMGKAIALLQMERYDEAEAEFTHLIDFLNRNIEHDDPTGTGVLAGAYANRGILYDRTGRYEKALADYINALKIDEGAVSGPGIVDKILYVRPRPATVRKRAQYLQEQLALPEHERLLRVPELDEEQRMHKP
jgi:tetratricopeptide (TPR) repeat protein